MNISHSNEMTGVSFGIDDKNSNGTIDEGEIGEAPVEYTYDENGTTFRTLGNQIRPYSDSELRSLFHTSYADVEGKDINAVSSYLSAVDRAHGYANGQLFRIAKNSLKRARDIANDNGFGHAKENYKEALNEIKEIRKEVGTNGQTKRRWAQHSLIIGGMISLFILGGALQKQN